jgi:hypothetical protein
LRTRVTTKDKEGKIHRPWVDLERPDLKNTPEDKKIAKRLALQRAKEASKLAFVGRVEAMAPKVTLALALPQRPGVVPKLLTRAPESPPRIVPARKGSERHTGQ